jgi:acyl carrier protein
VSTSSQDVEVDMRSDTGDIRARVVGALIAAGRFSITEEVVSNGRFGDDLGLDSLSLMNLIVLLERTFGLTVDGADISAENFATVEAVVALVEGKLKTP